MPARWLSVHSKLTGRGVETMPAPGPDGAPADKWPRLVSLEIPGYKSWCMEKDAESNQYRVPNCSLGTPTCCQHVGMSRMEYQTAMDFSKAVAHQLSVILGTIEVVDVCFNGHLVSSHVAEVRSIW